MSVALTSIALSRIEPWPGRRGKVPTPKPWPPPAPGLRTAAQTGHAG